MMKTLTMVGMAAVLWVGMGSSQACQTPVFRYALERWEPSPYTLLIYHRGPLKGDEQKMVEPLRAKGVDGNNLLNLAVKQADITTQLAPALLQVWQSQSNAPTPWMVLRYPTSDAESPTAWSGPLTQENVQRLADSPSRKEVARRIAKGDSAAWILLEGNNKAENDQVAKLLEDEFTKAEKTIELPSDPSSEETNAISLKVSFSLIRASRKDPAEAIFVNTLLALDEDLEKNPGPVAVPVFGRGRALCALPGVQLTSDIIRETFGFLTGACSCEVKDMNPGLDLLISCNWNEIVAGKIYSDPPQASLMGLGALGDLQKTNLMSQGKKTTASESLADISIPAPSGVLQRNLVYSGIGLVLAVLAITIISVRFKK